MHKRLVSRSPWRRLTLATLTICGCLLVGAGAAGARSEHGITYTGTWLADVDANIQLTPPSTTNRVGSNHVLTCHVNVDDGSGLTNAPEGTSCTASIQAGPGSFVGANQCATVGTTGDCQLTITSGVTGQTTIRAATDVTISGNALHRETGDTHAGDGPDATKLWVNASIIIGSGGTNDVGQPHTFTAGLFFDTGSGLFPAGSGQPITVTLTPGGGATPSPAGPFNLSTDGGGQVQVTFTSSTPGTVSGHASWTGSVAGSAPFTVETDNVPPNSGDAVKTFTAVADANIQLTPQSATNRVGSNHVLTCHVNVNDGSGFTNAPQGTTCTGSILSGPGSFVGTNQCTMIGTTGDCELTITSNATGLTTIRGTTDVTVSGTTVHRATGDAHAGDTPDATKLWVNAAIVIAPNATNEVGQPHTFTATLLSDTGGGLQPVAAGEPITVTLTPSGGAAAVPAGPFNLNTSAAGQVQVTFTSGTAGTVAGHASWTGSVAGSAPFTVETDGVAPNSPNAVKTFVDANIQLTPPDATNRVGTNHVLTCHVNVDDGSGLTNAPTGTTCTGSILSGPGSFVGTNQCTTVGTTGDCQLTITSNATGQTTIRAGTTVGVSGVAVQRQTEDTHPGDSPDATKRWVNAAIVIAPNGTNNVGEPHTFTATLLFDTGSGLQPTGAGEPITVTLTPAGGAVPVPAGPFNLSTSASGQVQVTFTSSTPGTVSGHASWTGSVNGSAPFTVETDGLAPNSPNAVKTFTAVVDASIQLTPPNGTNRVSTNHVLTCHVTLDDGSGLTNAPAGTACTGSILGGPGSFVGSNQCTTVGTTGDCQLTITSNATGQTTVRATTDVTVGGTSVHRETGDAHAGDSPDATKRWVNAAIVIAPNATNEVGQPHTFTATLLFDTGSGLQPTGAGEPITVTLTPAGGAAPVPAGPFNLSTSASGQVQVTFTSSTPGTVSGHASWTGSVAGSAQFTVETSGLAPNSPNAVKTFVDAYIEISPLEATNTTATTHTYTAHVYVSDGSGGYAPAPAGTLVTFTLLPGSVGSFTAGNTCTTSGSTGTCTIDTTSANGGDDTTQASTTVSVGGVVLTRTTGQPAPGHANSANAAKHWIKPNPVVTVVKSCPNGKQSDADRFGVVLNGTPTGDVLDCGGQVTVTLTPGVASTIREQGASSTTNLANYNVTYSGCDVNLPGGGTATCTITNTRLAARSEALSSGYWKNHQPELAALLPVSVGNFSVPDLTTAIAVFGAMNCGNAGIVGCLAGQLLAAKLNVKNGADNCINPVIAQADALFVAVGYQGPSNPLGSPLSSAQRQTAQQLQSALGMYNTGRGC